MSFFYDVHIAANFDLFKLYQNSCCNQP